MRAPGEDGARPSFLQPIIAAHQNDNEPTPSDGNRIQEHGSSNIDTGTFNISVLFRRSTRSG